MGNDWPDRRLPKRARVETEGWEGVDRELFEELRVLRLEIARRRRVPPYVIFHDTTLKQMAALRPADPEALLAIGGVGQAKLARYVLWNFPPASVLKYTKLP